MAFSCNKDSNKLLRDIRSWWVIVADLRVEPVPESDFLFWGWGCCLVVLGRIFWRLPESPRTWSGARVDRYGRARMRSVGGMSSVAINNEPVFAFLSDNKRQQTTTNDYKRQQVGAHLRSGSANISAHLHTHEHTRSSPRIIESRARAYARISVK